MIQDNNEAASADLIARQVDGWTKERDRLQDLINAASASQSSTAGPTKGGPDEAKTIDTFEFAKVFGAVLQADRKRAKTGASTDREWLDAHGAFIAYIDNFAHVARQESGAVAEGVDTAEFPKVAARFYMTEATEENPWRRESFSIEEEHRQKVEGVRGFHTPALEFITVEQGLTYGAQQREAGRREERDERFGPMEKDDWDKLAELRGVLDISSALPFTTLQYAVLRINRLTTMLARQPVSEGLTPAGLDLSSVANSFRFIERNLEALAKRLPVFSGGAELDDSLGTAGRVAREIERALSAVPPAKAEGMSDTERHAIIKAVQQHLVDVVRSFGDVSCAAYISTYHKPDHIAAILAQQAKKGGAA